ncbi:hypothetical protein DERF_007441 [Dermatophagoides farinae]|uniref:Uncharacterized protein n=1 Tax=Dermatophagoides farinae TaxID=6954 RepID=A0A922L603_DERFA|nr:hypothetical protein DERF_007441 [Dermatophagoides farinae]
MHLNIKQQINNFGLQQVSRIWISGFVIEFLLLLLLSLLD